VPESGSQLYHALFDRCAGELCERAGQGWFRDVVVRSGRNNGEARSHGDLSENAEYEAAKEKQGFIEGRIAELENKLSLAQVIDPKEIHADGRIVFGTTVTVLDLETDDETTYQIVGDDEADIKEFKISVNSPIARAMIGKEEGDIAEVQAPSGVREYEILTVQYI